MAIKQSTLEKKWYYRAAKVFFILLPFIMATTIFVKSDMLMPKFTEKDFSAFIQTNINTIVYVILGIIFYFVFLNLVRKTILYIVFGGVENDLVKNAPSAQTVAASGSGSLSDEDKKQIGLYLSILIILGIIYYVYFIYKPDNHPIQINNGGNHSNCVPTGCGSLWRCDGTYYDSDGVQRSLHACLRRKAEETYSSWSGTCRQCP